MENKSRMWRSGLSLILVLCMVISMCPVTAFAAEKPKETIVYASLGDSMTNGYCLFGYEGNSGGVNYGVDSYANQFAAYLAGYTGSIANDQVIFEGDRAIVDHRPLAISGMRSQDIQWVLELDLENDDLLNWLYQESWNPGTWYDTYKLAGDSRTRDDFVNRDYRYGDAAAKILAVYGEDSSYFKSSYASGADIAAAKSGIAANPYYPEGDTANALSGKYLHIATEYFQESVKDADVISLGVGNTNFGTFMLNAVTDVAMYNDLDFSKEFPVSRARAQADEFALAKVDAMLASDAYKAMENYLILLGGTDTAKQAEIKKILEYCMTSFIVGYVGMLDAILDVNPDAQIVMIALMNAYSNDGAIESGTLGELVQVIYNPVNAMLKALPAELIASKDAETQAKYANAEFFFAETASVSCMVDVFGDDFYMAGGSYVKYPGLLKGDEGYTANSASIVRDRFVEEIVSGNYLFKQMGISVPMSNADFLKGAVAYDMKPIIEKALFAAENEQSQNLAKLYALYLGFENALIRCGTENVTLESIAKLSQASGLFNTAMVKIYAKNSSDLYDDIAPAVSQIAAAKGASVSAEQVVGIMGAYENMKNQVWAAFADYHPALAQAAHPSMDYVIRCDDCMKEDGSAHGNAVLQQIVANYKAALADLPYQIVAETVKAKVNDESIKAMITPAVIKTLCTADNYTNAVYDLVIGIAAQKGFTLTREDVALIMTDGGEYQFAEQYIKANEPSYSFLTADMIKKWHLDGTIAEINQEYDDMLDMLVTMKSAVSALLAAEGEIKGGAAGVPVVIEGAYSLAYLMDLPQTMSDVMFNDSDAQGGLTMNARCILGTGAGGHPSTGGHNALFNAVKAVYKFHEHTYTSVVTKPTCTEDGYTTHTCSCGYSYTDSEVKTSGHSWDDGKRNDEGIIVYHCQNCTATRNGMPGDANNDGEVTLLDAQLIMKCIVDENVSEMNLAVCDVYQDGKITLKDAQTIMQFRVDLIDKLPFVPAA